MMTDREMHVSLGCAIATGLWVATVVLLTLGTLLSSHDAQSWGLAMSAAAATATIRQYFVGQNRVIRNAFQLGRDVARNDEVLTTMRPR